MKKYCKCAGDYLNKLYSWKIFQLMRNTMLLVFIITLQVNANDTYSQNTKLTLNLDNVTVADVLAEIQNNSEFYFLFNAKLIDVRREVSVSMEDSKISEILTSLFSGTGVNYLVYKRQIILTLSDVTPLAAALQQLKITGTVTDDKGNPLPGVTIRVKGITLGTLTDASGKYTIENTPQNATLIFSFVGMATQEIPSDGRMLIDVVLKEEAIGLEEVVVVGYGTQKRKSITSSFSSVNMDDAIKVTTSSVGQNLQGRAAGLTADLNSAQPGGSIKLQIRGSATGRSPLIVIDGMPTSDFSIPKLGYPNLGTGSIDATISTLNPNDIESIDILKDASATAIYGSRAAGGVILITTKKGQADGTFSVNLNSSAGIQNYFRVPEMLDPVGYMEQTNRVLKERWLYDSRMDVYSNVTKPDNWLSPGDYLPYYTETQINEFASGQKTGTDWVGEVSRTGRVQNHNLSFQGNSKDTRFYASLSLYDQKGIVKKNDYSKFSGRINVDQNLGKKINAGMNLTFSQIKSDNVSIGDGMMWEASGVLLQALQFDPTLPVFDSQGNFQPNLRMANFLNPVSILEISNESRLERFLSTAFVNYKILPELSIRGQVGFDRNQANTYIYTPVTVLMGKSFGGQANRADAEQSNYQLQFLINYIKTFDVKHNLSSTLGYEYMQFDRESMNIRARNFPYDGALWNNLGLGADRPSVESSGGSSEIASYFLRVSYDFDNKYFINANFRLDGSSKFSPINQYAFFPGISIGWELTRESFMEFSKNWLNQLKLRAGYGITGNDNIGTAFSNWYSAGANTYWGTNTISGVRLAGIGNPDLRWEKQVDINVGVDFSLFKNDRIMGSVEFFSREVSNILGAKNLVSYNAITSISYNMDALKQTYGAELTLNTRNINLVDFSWNSLFTLTYYRDRWLKRDPSYVYAINDSPKQLFNELWYYKSDGLVPVGTDDPLNEVPGIVKILDVNGYLEDGSGNRVVDERGKPQYSGSPDGMINDADKVKVGVNVPVIIGFSNTLNYKQFDLSFYTYGMFNRWKINATKDLLGGPQKYNIVGTALNMIKDDMLSSWSSNNQIGTESSLLQDYAGKYGTGDFYLEKAWFIRVRSINIGYTFLQKRLRLYCDLLNPFLFTPYTGMDPETDAYVAPYPNQRTFSLGLQLNIK